MNISQFKKKFKKQIIHFDDYDDDRIIYTVVTDGKYLSKKDCPEGYFIYKIGSTGPVGDYKNHSYMQDIVPKKKKNAIKKKM